MYNHIDFDGWYAVYLNDEVVACLPSETLAHRFTESFNYGRMAVKEINRVTPRVAGAPVDIRHVWGVFAEGEMQQAEAEQRPARFIRLLSNLDDLDVGMTDQVYRITNWIMTDE